MTIRMRASAEESPLVLMDTAMAEAFAQGVLNRLSKKVTAADVHVTNAVGSGSAFSRGEMENFSGWDLRLINLQVDIGGQVGSGATSRFDATGLDVLVRQTEDAAR